MSVSGQGGAVMSANGQGGAAALSANGVPLSPALAAAINPTGTAKATVMRGSTQSQSKADKAKAALSAGKPSLSSEGTHDGKPDPVKKALSDVMRKRELEKQKAEAE